MKKGHKFKAHWQLGIEFIFWLAVDTEGWNCSWTWKKSLLEKLVGETGSSTVMKLMVLVI